MSRSVIAFSILVCSICAYGQGSGEHATYFVVEVDRFVAEGGVVFPPDYQITLVEDIIRETKHTFKSVEIVREGEALPDGKAVLRLAGKITEFKPGNRAKRYLIGFGAGATKVKARVKFIDAKSGDVILDRDLEGITWIGVMGGSSEGAGHQIAKTIVDTARIENLIGQK
jgi:hypothetical protein